MPSDQLLRYWKGKEKEYENSVSEYLHTLEANMDLVREMANEREKKEKMKQKGNMMRRLKYVPLKWAIFPGTKYRNRKHYTQFTSNPGVFVYSFIKNFLRHP